jgi:hypothetical protein
MKIGVITIVLNENYGGILQAFALQKVLKEMGHDVTLIDRWRGWYFSFWGKCKSYSKRFVERFLLGRNTPIRYDIALQNEIKVISKYTRPFIDKYIKRIITRDFSEIKANDFDAYIIGSDQIWRAPASRPQLYNAYLDFAKDWNVKRISYAASFGTNEWEYSEEETFVCGNLLKKFDAISVREIGGVHLCKEKFNVDAKFVLDPTMLIKKEEYSKLFENAETQQSVGELFCYILDKDRIKEQIITDVAATTNYKPFFINSKYQEITAPIAERIQRPVEEWLRGFYDAKFVVTDSFHGCVFSIIYNKPFIVYKNNSRGNARFDSLLKTFNLEDRVYNKEFGLDTIINNNINWDFVNEKLSKLQKYSYNFLESSLKLS